MIATLEIRPSFMPNSLFQIKKTHKSALLSVGIRKQLLPIPARQIQHDLSGIFESQAWRIRQEKRINREFLIERNYWEVEVSPKKVGEIITLTEKVIQACRYDKRIILDGVYLICSLEKVGKHEKKKEYPFRCPQKDTEELKLVELYFALAEEFIEDPHFINYIELIESYFYSKPPYKEFDEQPYRLRMYGLWSIYEKEALREILQRLSQKEELLIDMTNFQGMGTSLYECFQPLLTMKKLHFLVNERARKQLKEIGIIC
jgi:hypothetical protein